jgi:hypothetical protein
MMMAMEIKRKTTLIQISISLVVVVLALRSLQGLWTKWEEQL